MVGTVASRTTASIRPAPPRGMTTSTSPRAWIRWVTLERSELGSSCTASSGRPSPASAPRSTRTSSALDFAAEELPRSSTALPDFSVNPKASTVTLGRPRRRCRRRRGEPAADAAAGRWAWCDRAAPRRSGRQPGHLAQAGGDPVDALRVQREPVQHRLGRARGAGGVEVLGVGGQDLVDMGQHGISGGVQRAVLRRGGQRAQDAGGDPRPAGGVMDLGTHIGPQHRGRQGPGLGGCAHAHRPSVSVSYQPAGGGCRPSSSRWPRRRRGRAAPGRRTPVGQRAQGVRDGARVRQRRDVVTAAGDPGDHRLPEVGDAAVLVPDEPDVAPVAGADHPAERQGRDPGPHLRC